MFSMLYISSRMTMTGRVVSSRWRMSYRAASTTPTHPHFNKILIANRGEIACRIMRTAKRLGVKTVAVYSSADASAMHVQMADEAYHIGPAPSSESYLNANRILDVAHKSGAQAIHPGYGFLSENAAFATQVTESGLVFIGPPAQAILSMGSKSESKKIMQDASVPVVPGYHGEEQSVERLQAEAERIGYPVLIKAVKGGGGKGMRIVETPQDFKDMLESAKREATKSFGDDTVLVEKYLTRPRHVEVQVFADTHGNAVYLFERDCSVQRRHQKVLEEAPAPGLSPELRASLGAKAVAAAKAVNYVGAGTVEFILDTLDDRFYFMEMNTRLQVEHPVTEMITNTDLVEWQLLVASGNPLPKTQSSLEISGHAFEARIYAENPAKGFLPDTGKLFYMKMPDAAPNVRVETGVRQGDDVSVYYDPMISKLVVSGPNRTEALRTLRNALNDFHVAGPTTNIPFLTSLATHPSFISGDISTSFIADHADTLSLSAPITHETLAQAAMGLVSTCSKTPTETTPWTTLPSFRLNHPQTRTLTLHDQNSTPHKVTVTTDPQTQTHTLTTKTPTSTRTFSSVTAHYNPTTQILTTTLDSTRLTTPFIQTDQTLHLPPITLSIPTITHTHAETSANTIKTPMPCKISAIHVVKGDTVKKGQVVLVLEAMKMEHVVRAPGDGIVKRVFGVVGDVVPEGRVLVEFGQV
ncbi:acetyl-CoA carboxylase, biotin carboxylase subunit [Spizellomyces punctatus DAOM BR117]|uniref:Acetyl-CoA carboxylase, biotin carboxylase subunit n=1 Tax=Spizellomyces punctatus (strain DAOM BR117) TaxID=645134 RepID=A0A0L0H5T1_SPIPD|nr:acetyl-CoA carboxylase, biotin carboxylase subunit [Spizellomyces punctatus DAOM BR117]KNC96329.1 acetyl-CoA carboxylase, biotin carboxylase subunit [Spizellomyces punctatus DAOM BR117]|eukprot:XP_016604369.1 acetyl-CoA carboxylase, biotin carboxylase subunit [Spizellomyces punctatus DAOM BR117]